MIDLRYLQDAGGEKKEHDLVLFALSTCGWCRKARRFLDENGIGYMYVYVDLLSGDDLKEAVREIDKWNPKRSFPTLIIDEGDVLVGFKEAQYEEKLL